MARIPSLAVMALLALAPACKDAKDDDDGGTPALPEEQEANDFAQDGTDANAADTDAQLVASSLVSSSPGALGLASFGGNLGTQDVGDGVAALYLPRNCASGRQTAEREATYTFEGCLGPNGLRGITGTVKATYRLEASALVLTLEYTGLVVNGATISGIATASITAEGNQRSMAWSANLGGTTAREKDFTYVSAHTIGWTLGEACFSLDGSATGQVRKRELRTTVSDFRRCRRGCPEAGGKIAVTNVAKDKTVTIDYDGSARATFTAPNGQTFPLQLLCKE